MALIARYTTTSTQTSGYTTAFGEKVNCDPSGGGFTVTLPPISGGDGRQILIKNVTTSTNTITIDGDGSETIDGSTTKTITTSRGSLVLVCDETLGEWSII